MAFGAPSIGHLQSKIGDQLPRPFPEHSFSQPLAAVHHQNFAGDEISVVRDQVGSGAGDFLGLADAAAIVNPNRSLAFEPMAMRQQVKACRNSADE